MLGFSFTNSTKAFPKMEVYDGSVPDFLSALPVSLSKGVDAWSL
jgi:hypothetical protein